MALLLNWVQPDGEVLTYHRIASIKVTSTSVVTATLESFPDAAARANPAIVPVRREYDFPVLAGEDGSDIVGIGYRALLAMEEWDAAESDEDGVTAREVPAVVSGTMVWDPDSLQWTDGGRLVTVVQEKAELLIQFFERDNTADLTSMGQTWLMDRASQDRLRNSAIMALQAADRDTFTRTWFLEDWDGPVTLNGHEILQLMEDLEARQAAVTDHLEVRRQELLAAASLTPESAAIAAVNAVTWGFVWPP